MLMAVVSGVVRVATAAQSCSEGRWIAGAAQWLLQQGEWKGLQTFHEHTLIKPQLFINIVRVWWLEAWKGLGKGRGGKWLWKWLDGVWRDDSLLGMRSRGWRATSRWHTPFEPIWGLVQTIGTCGARVFTVSAAKVE